VDGISDALSIEIVDNLEAALEQFIGIYEELGGAGDTPSEVNPFAPRS
jgi:hypothetical protein